MKKFLMAVCILAGLMLCNVAQAAQVIVLDVKTPQSCPHFNEIAADLNSMQFPSDWKIYVSCSPMTWQTIRTKLDNPQTEAALTYRPGKTTVINNAMWDADYNFNGYAQRTPHRILLHELGHITCQSDREEVADRFADKGVCR